MRINKYWVAGGVGLLVLLTGKKAAAQVVEVVKGLKMDKQGKWAAEFVKTAQPICDKYGLPIQICVAQAALESAWGAAAPGGNYFGIKGKGPAGSTNVTTKEEFTPGTTTTIKDNFAAYSSTEQSIEGWCKFVTTERYIPPEGAGVASRMLWIWARGYATASQYPSSIVGVAASVAKRIGPQFKIEMSAPQKKLATQLSALKPADRQKKALELAALKQWPL